MILLAIAKWQSGMRPVINPVNKAKKFGIWNDFYPSAII